MKLWNAGCEAKQKDTNSLFQKKVPKVLNIFDLIIIGLGSSLAVGTSVLIGELTKCVAGPAVVVSIFLAGVTALFGGLCSAEFGVQFLKIDSAYPYSYCWGKSTGAFIFGWALLLEHIAGTASVAKGIISFTDSLADNKISDLLKNNTTTYFSEVFPYFDYFSFAIILLITILISIGLKDSILFKKLITTCSIILLIALIIAGAFKADIKNWENEQIMDKGFEKKNGFIPFGGLGVVKGAAVAFYGFIGFDNYSFTGIEITKRKKNFPIAIFASIFFTLVIFSGIGVILILMLPYTELSSYAAVPFAFQHVGWTALKWVAVVATFLAFPTSFFGVVFPLPRIIHAMANDGLLFHCLANNHRRFKTPVFATVTGGLFTAVGAGIFTFQILVNLAVIGALFVYTTLAFNVILHRYFPKFEDNEKEFWKSLVCNNSNVSLKALVRNYFNFKEKQPTNLTKAIIMGNLVLLCFCSVGLGVIFNFFYVFLVSNAAEAVIPASILLCIMFSNVISIFCQPKSQEVVPFKVPLFPFITCLSIFLNIFLMITFDSFTWILFTSWMILGVLPYCLWDYRKFHKDELRKTSLYEINRINMVKLNESILKIKSDKKSFYEGAVNPVFSLDLDEDNRNNEKNIFSEIQKHNKETPLQLKQDEIIQKVETDVEKKPQHLKRELQLNFIPEDIDDDLKDESDNVHWECVAEIHTEEEFSPEHIALEIVDNTYNFLSDVSEDMTKDDVNEDLVISKEKLVGDEEKKRSTSDSLELLETNQKHLHSLNNKNELEMFKEKLFSEIEPSVNINNNEKKELKNEYKDNVQNKIPIVLQNNSKEIKDERQGDSVFSKSTSAASDLPFCDKNLGDEKLVYLIVETFYEAHKSEMILQQDSAPKLANIDGETEKAITDEQNKVKDFKEKLNQLLKNQINNVDFFTKNSSLSKSVNAVNSEISSEENKDATHNSIKTLNKSQIKNKLELLLAKKPQRPSLKSSFNITLKKTENENKMEETNDDTSHNHIFNDSEKEKNVKPSSILVNSIKEKVLALKNVDSESNDICC